MLSLTAAHRLDVVNGPGLRGETLALPVQQPSFLQVQKVRQVLEQLLAFLVVDLQDHVLIWEVELRRVEEVMLYFFVAMLG